MVALVTASSTLIWSLNVHLVKDLAEQNQSKKKSKIILNFSWGWTILLGMLALAFSYYNVGIASLILESYELAVVCMFVPLVQAAFSRGKEYPKLAAGLSMCFGGLGFFLCRFYEISYFPEVFSILLSWTGFMLGKSLSRHKIVPNEQDSEIRCSQ